MASTTALLTGLSGMNANARRLDIIGNNIANVNTTAFKSNRALFSPTFSRTLSAGSGPSGVSGGTSPTQIGLGVSIAGTQRNFANGGISATGQASDLAVEGNGFFVVKRADQAFYTRNGSFQLNATRELISASGDRVQGFAVDDNFNVIEGNLTGLTIPIGSLTIAGATQNVDLAGNLNAGGTLPTSSSDITFDQVFQTTLAVPMTNADLLGTLEDPANPGVPLFPGLGPFDFRLTGVKKGGKALPDADFIIDPAVNTVQDMLDFINQSLGIVPGLANPDLTSVAPFNVTGANIDPLTGQVKVISNSGTANEITLGQTNIKIFDPLAVQLNNPFTFTEITPATGESVRTTFAVYDSLGSTLDIDLTLVLDNKTATGTTWRYYFDSGDNLSTLVPGRAISNGTIDFDNFGRLQTTTPVTIQIGRLNTGAEDPLTVDVSFTSAGNKVTSLTNSNTSQSSTLAAVFQDGTPIGTLTNFSVGSDGVIAGGFSNGLARTIGRVAVATFSKPEGLFDAGNDLFAVGPNSGAALITTPGQFGAGKIIGGALEQSNVDLGQEFIELVLTSTGYSASSRVISTADQLLQQLIALGR